MNYHEPLSHAVRAATTEFAYRKVIAEICGFRWSKLTRAELTNVAWAYYYFSIQFRESLEIARRIFPDDERLLQLDQGERDTDNLSPWPGVASAGEKLNHDEFVRRTLALAPIPESRQREFAALGESYLAKTRAIDDMTRALSLASYEDGGLESVFTAILTAQNWDDPLLQAFKHFLDKHVSFDSDPEAGHGALCRHLTPDDRVLPLWNEFRDILIKAAPALTD